MLGVPVIGAGVCAFPELIGDRTSGWLVEMPLREDGRWSGLELSGEAKLTALADANDRMVAGIRDCVIAVHDDPTLLARWGAEGRRRTVEHYGMAAASQKLEKIYDEALAALI